MSSNPVETGGTGAARERLPDRVELIERSVRVLYVAGLGLVPFLGVMAAWDAWREARRIKKWEAQTWNPARVQRRLALCVAGGSFLVNLGLWIWLVTEALL